ncbi:MAG TPA: hypothetical protein VFJ78_00845 [Gaiellaceae bacterium]|nr:hypothetical protein [Gaiellaceae bacterium]
MSALALLLTAAACMGAPIRSEAGGLRVHAGPYVGVVTAYDVVRGRFALRVGPDRTASGLSQKIPWFPEAGTPLGPTLVVSGRTLSRPAHSFRQTFQAAVVSGRTMFPTIIAPPSTGCWLLTFTSGPTTASIPVTVRPRPSD